MNRTLCRDCAEMFAGDGLVRCPACGSPRLFRHEELAALSIAHSRDDPHLRITQQWVFGLR